LGETWSGRNSSRFFFRRPPSWLDQDALGFGRDWDRPITPGRSGGAASENPAATICRVSPFSSSLRTLRTDAMPSFQACSICLVMSPQRGSFRAASIISRPVSTALLESYWADFLQLNPARALSVGEHAAHHARAEDRPLASLRYLGWLASRDGTVDVDTECEPHSHLKPILPEHLPQYLLLHFPRPRMRQFRHEHHIVR
jgi:hypothetical protein